MLARPSRPHVHYDDDYGHNIIGSGSAHSVREVEDVRRDNDPTVLYMADGTPIFYDSPAPIGFRPPDE